jgi:hypothetical protein
MLERHSVVVFRCITIYMLDWFSQTPMAGESREAVKGPEQRQIIRDYVFHKSDGELLFLSEIGLPMVMVFLPLGFPARQTYFARSG